MKAIGALMLLTLATACAPTAPTSRETQQGFAAGIVGGTVLAASDPLARSTVMVIDFAPGNDCSGTLVAEDIVLTASHCVDGGVTSVRLVFSNQRTNHDELVRHAVAIRRHEFYKLPGEDRNDIALVRFDGMRPPGFVTARLPDEDLTSYTSFTAVGYGVTNGHRGRMVLNDSGILRATKLHVQALSPTGAEFTIDQSRGHGVCFGDSGGPAYAIGTASGDEAAPVLVGFANDVFTPGFNNIEPVNYDYCAHSAHATNVFFYKNWIEATIEELSRAK